MRLCTACHKMHDDNQRFCTRCGAMLPVQVDRSAQAEAEHIGYLLGEIPGWQIRHLITRETAETLRHEYAIRRDAISGTPVPLPTTAPPPRVVEPHPDTPVAAGEPALVAEPTTYPPPAVRPDEAVPAGRAWIAGFLEAHWVKLLAALGIALTFAGMKQVLGWEWVSQLALALIPCLPIALCLVPLGYGLRAYRPGVLGPVAWSVVGCWMAVFALGSVNKHWFGDAIPGEWCYAGGFALATVMAIGCLTRCPELAFVRSASVTLIAGVFAVLRGLFPSDPLELTPMWAYCGTPLLLAAAFAAAAYAARDREGGLPEGSSTILLAWGHVCTSLALTRALLGIISPGTGALSAWLPVLAATGLYVAISSAFSSSGVAYTAGAFALLTAQAYLLAADRMNWHSGATSALIIAFAAAGIALAFRQSAAKPGERPALFSAYARISVAAASLSGLIVLARLLWAIAEPSRSALLAEWPTGTGIALATAVAFAVMAIYYRRSEVLYAATVALLGASVTATEAMLHSAVAGPPAPLPILPIPYALSLGLVGLWLCHRREADQPDWGRPLCHAALAGTVLVACMAPWWLVPGLKGGRLALLAGFLPAALISGLIAGSTRRWPWITVSGVSVAQVATASAACVAVAVLGPAAISLPPTSVSVGLALVSAVACLAAAVVGSNSHPWSVPLRFGSGILLVGAACASIVAIHPLTGSEAAVNSHLWQGYLVAAAAYSIAACLRSEARQTAAGLLAFGLALMWWCYSTQVGLRGAWVALPCGISLLACVVTWFASASTRRPGFAALGSSALLVAILFALCEGHGRLMGLNVPAAAAAILAVGLAGMLLRPRFEEWWGSPARDVAYVAASLYVVWLAYHGWTNRPVDGVVSTLSALAVATGATAVAVVLRSGPWAWLAALAATATAAAGSALIPASFSASENNLVLVLVIGAAACFIAASATKVDEQTAPDSLPLTIAGVAAMAVVPILVCANHLSAGTAPLRSPDWLYAASAAVLLAASLPTRLPDPCLRLWSAVGLTLGAFIEMAFQHSWGVAWSSGLVVAGLLVTAGVGRVAWQERNISYATGMGAALMGTWLVCVHRAAMTPAGWDGALSAGGFALMAVATSGSSQAPFKFLASGCRRSAGVAMAFLAVLIPYIGWAGPDGITADDVMAGAMMVAAAAAVAVIRSSSMWVWLLAACIASATHSTAHWRHWSDPASAALMAGLAAALIVLGDTRQEEEDLTFRRAAWHSGALLAALAACLALVSVATANEGRFSVLALALFGAIYAALYIRKMGDGFAHGSFVGFFLAYAITLYDKIHFVPDVLDFYLLPVGLYLIAAGDVSDRRGGEQAAAALWTVGCLTVLTPAFCSFLANNHPTGNPVHSLVLLLECSALLVWGIASRVRAFVLTGASFLLLCALVLGIGAARQVWSGLFALLLGLGMLGLVTYVTVKREELQAWMVSAKESWGQWR